MERDLIIYKIHKPVNTYDVIDLDAANMADQIVDEIGCDFRQAVIMAKIEFPTGKRKILDVIKNGLTCKVDKDAIKQNYDINLFTNYLVLNKKAFDAIGNHLQAYGEFIPLKCDKELHLFNPLEFENEDLTLTEKTYLNGIEDGLKSLVFKSDEKLVFKSKIQGGSSIFCNSAFKTLVKENNLSGLTFNNDLVSIFA